MKNRDEFVKRLRTWRGANTAFEAASRSFHEAETEFTSAFRENGGEEIIVFPPDSGAVIIRIKRWSQTEAGKYSLETVGGYTEGSVVAKKLRRFRVCLQVMALKRFWYSYSPKMFKFVASLGVIPSKLRLVRFGEHYFEKKDEQWVRMG